MKNILKPSVGLLAIALLVLPGRAQTIDNADFTSPGSSAFYGPYPTNQYFLATGAGGAVSVDDWTFSDPESVGGVAANANVPSGVAAFFNNTDDGLGSDPTGFPLNTITYSGALPTISDTSYTLTVALGVPYGQVADYKLSLLVDGSPTYATATVNSANFGLAGSGTTATGNGYTNFYDFSVTLSAATIEADSLVGKQLGVQLGSQEISPDLPYSVEGDFSQTYFSDVRLVPEPSTFALVGLAGGFGLLFLRGRMRRSAV